MGPSQRRFSSKAPSLRVYLTGFGPFGEVEDNPSACIVRKLAAYLSSAGSPRTSPGVHETSVDSSVLSPGLYGEHEETAEDPPVDRPESPLRAQKIELCGWEILEVSADAAMESVPRIHYRLSCKEPRSGVHDSDTSSKNNFLRLGQKDHEGPLCPGDELSKPLSLALHFGVNTKSNCWKLESHGKNGISVPTFYSLPILFASGAAYTRSAYTPRSWCTCCYADARFSCNDVRGYCPSTNEISASMPLGARLSCSLALKEIAADLNERGFPCSVSSDAGCFVCNYLYFRSLQEGKKTGVVALFVHLVEAPKRPTLSLQQKETGDGEGFFRTSLLCNSSDLIYALPNWEDHAFTTGCFLPSSKVLLSANHNLNNAQYDDLERAPAAGLVGLRMG
ncbi:chromatin organization modifier domain-containing protein [Cyclospora cayetanensis]|uniref:Pyroglutamyl-peptidase I n=1 Tax=Cyclospora cayetanensis TaxID=88456 RepID=A0A1D3CVR1_9EIME|nr:chromatin organization modifier domain-containing protein [Cyclospora cayetanensis]